MTYPVIAITERDGPVVIARCDTEAEQRRQYREALRCLRDGGFSDVVGIELGPPSGGQESGDSHVTAALPPPANRKGGDAPNETTNASI